MSSISIDILPAPCPGGPGSGHCRPGGPGPGGPGSGHCRPGGPGPGAGARLDGLGPVTEAGVRPGARLDGLGLRRAARVAKTVPIGVKRILHVFPRCDG